MTPHVCPECGADLRYEESGQTYSRVIGVEIRGVYDGVLFWACPGCSTTWHRWPEGDPYRDKAAPYMERFALRGEG